jgi:alpha-amylase
MYYGQEQHLPGNFSPYNRQALWDASPAYDQSSELYSLTTNLNKMRNHAISVDNHYLTNWSSILYHDGSTYATRKGPNGAQIIAVLSNQGTQGGDYTLEINGVADPGTNLTEVTRCNSTVVAGPNGTITVPMGQGQPRVYFPTFNLNNSVLCGQSSPSLSLSSPAQPSATASFITQHGLGTSTEAPAWLHVVLLAVMMVALV